MTTATTTGPDTMQARSGHVVTALAARQIRRSALIVAAVCAGMSALVVAMYHSQALDPAALVALARNPAIRTLFGEPVALDDPGGFTVWRTGVFLAVLLAVWSFLAATRITRGEEDAGRWHLLLSGRTALPRAVRSHLGVVAVAPLVAGAATAAAMSAAGAGVTGALLHGTGLATVGFFFVAVGGFTAQLFAGRSAANGAAAAVLVLGLLARMVGDGVSALAWLRWLSPFGLVALTRPFDTNQVLPLSVLASAAVMVLYLSTRLAARRDVGAAIIASANGRPARTTLLGSVTAFAVRRTLRPLAGWMAGIAAYFLLIGLVARSMTEFLTSNPQLAQMAAQAGFSLGSVEGYAATLFALLAIPVGVFVAARLTALAADEHSQRLTLLLTATVTRTRLLAAEAAVATGAALILVTVAGLAVWVGTATVGAGLGLGDALTGAFNVVPVVLLCLGAAILTLGWVPRAVAAIGTLPATGGFLWLIIADSIQAPTWIGDLSPFAHLAAVPATSPNWFDAAIMTGLAIIGVIVGIVGYSRRDLST
ncbi:ABC transporter permease [Micromonospora echinospora]|uniref:ABC transporter permease n=1 Tax=Micromonospora echinospora TaxID=1877 RepID=UPI003A85477B